MPLPVPPNPNHPFTRAGRAVHHDPAQQLAQAPRDTQLEAIAGGMQLATGQFIVDLWHDLEESRETNPASVDAVRRLQAEVDDLRVRLKGKDDLVRGLRLKLDRALNGRPPDRPRKVPGSRGPRP
jgi:hypothetical protein